MPPRISDEAIYKSIFEMTVTIGALVARGVITTEEVEFAKGPVRAALDQFEAKLMEEEEES
jgi:hypothetical protein